MAAVRKHYQSIFYISNLHRVWWKESFRIYSQYPQTYQVPICEKNKVDRVLKEKPKEELQELNFKAAKNDQTCSVFYDEDIKKFINLVCRKGGKATARTVVERALTNVKHIQLRKYYAEEDEEKRKEIMISSQEIFHLALKNLMPALRTQKYKRSGTWYSVPVGVTPKKAMFMGMKWLINVTNEKNGIIPFEKRLAEELIAAAHYEGAAIRKKIELHKLCEANRGYAHYRWT